MTACLTVRLSADKREGLRRRARLLKRSESELVRALIDRELQDSSISEKLGTLIGGVDSGKRPAGKAHPLAAKIRAGNWRR